MSKSTPKLLRVRQAGPDHQVVTVTSASKAYRRQPCPSCPWRADATGTFPAEAFRHSAETAYDMSQYVFSCHESGQRKQATCAGLLLRGATHNLAVRLGYLNGRYCHDVTDGGHELHPSYAAMAVANGVLPDEPCLAACRGRND